LAEVLGLSQPNGLRNAALAAAVASPVGEGWMGMRKLPTATTPILGELTEAHERP